MKLSLVALASVIPATSAEFSLRAAIDQMFSSAKAESYDARIVVGGVKDTISNEEATYVTKQAVAAFDETFGVAKTGQKIADILPRGVSNIAPDSFWWTSSTKNSGEEAAIINAVVDMLSYQTETTADVGDDMFHKFEANLCDRLRQSGFSNFDQAKNCSFSFLTKPGMANKLPVKAAYPMDNKHASEAQLAIVGLKSGMTQDDKEVLNKVVIEAHKEAFAKSGMSLASFETLVGFGVDGHHSGWLHQCPFCCWVPDDDKYDCPASYDAVTLVIANVLPLRSSAASLQAAEAQFSHEAFETFVCSKLRNSGNSNFENVHDCTFNFAFTAIGH